MLVFTCRLQDADTDLDGSGAILALAQVPDGPGRAGPAVDVFSWISNAISPEPAALGPLSRAAATAALSHPLKSVAVSLFICICISVVFPRPRILSLQQATATACDLLPKFVGLLAK